MGRGKEWPELFHNIFESGKLSGRRDSYRRQRMESTMHANNILLDERCIEGKGIYT